MATRYARSTDGASGDNGSTWALAKDTVANAGSGAAGDIIYVSQVHAESSAGAYVITSAGTLAAPTRIICGNDAAEPPTALAASATVTNITSGNMTISGSCYVYGISFRNSTGSTPTLIHLGSSNHWQKYENCEFQLLTTASASKIYAPQNTTIKARIDWKNCSVKFSAAGQSIGCCGRLHWNGGSVLAGGTSPTVLLSGFNAAATDGGGSVLVENVDLSNCSSSLNLSDPPQSNTPIVFRNCKLPGSWSGSPKNATLTTPGRIEMFNCDSGATNYKLWIEDYAGSIRDETTLIRSGGASDGTTSLSWKMVTVANVAYPHVALASPEMAIWNDTTGSAKTVTVEILRDSASNLKDDEIWLEVNYYASGSNPQGTLITDAKADILATAADQTTSTETWTTTGMSNPNKQKLAVTFTPAAKGFFLARVMLAKASTTVYVDPKLTVT